MWRWCPPYVKWILEGKELSRQVANSKSNTCMQYAACACRPRYTSRQERSFSLSAVYYLPKVVVAGASALEPNMVISSPLHNSEGSLKVLARLHCAHLGESTCLLFACWFLCLRPTASPVGEGRMEETGDVVLRGIHVRVSGKVPTVYCT
jgi:hypothetical protein